MLNVFPNKLRVLGGILRPPLLETKQAQVVEFRDAFGTLIALFSRDDDGSWVFVTKEDEEWPEQLGRWLPSDGSSVSTPFERLGSQPGEPGRIGVFRVLSEEPLLFTHEASLIEVWDSQDELFAVFTRHFSDDMWIFVTKDDDDWDSHLVRLGYRAPTQQIRDVLREAAVKGD